MSFKQRSLIKSQKQISNQLLRSVANTVVIQRANCFSKARLDNIAHPVLDLADLNPDRCWSGKIFRHNRLKDIINTSLPDRCCPMRGERPHKSRVVTATECSQIYILFFQAPKIYKYRKLSWWLDLLMPFIGIPPPSSLKQVPSDILSNVLFSPLYFILLLFSGVLSGINKWRPM